MALTQYHLFTKPIYTGSPPAWVYPYPTSQLGINVGEYGDILGTINIPKTNASIIRLYFSQLSLYNNVNSQIVSDEVKFTCVISAGTKTVFSENIATASSRFVDLLLGDTQDFAVGSSFTLSITANSYNAAALPTSVLPWSVNFQGTILEPFYVGVKATRNVYAYSIASASIGTQTVLASEIQASAVSDAFLIGATGYIRATGYCAATTTGQIQGGVQIYSGAQASASTTATISQSYGISGNGILSSFGQARMSVGSPVGLQAAASASVTSASKDLLIEQRVSGMTLYVSLDTRQFVVSPILLQPITEIYFTRRDIEAIDIKFVRGGKTLALSYGANGKIGIKNSFSGDALAVDPAWGKRGEASDAAYQFSLNLNTEEINALFETDNEISVVAKVELEWTEGGTVNTTMPCTAVIYNDVLRGTEGAPTPATVASYVDLRADDNSIWRVAVDEDGSLTATKQL